jgi:hypothetical protein
MQEEASLSPREKQQTSFRKEAISSFAGYETKS